MKNLTYYETSIGRLGIAENGQAITNVFFKNNKKPANCQEATATPLLEKAAQQIKEYLAGKRRGFDLPLEMEGTEFQQKVWQALTTIPYGQTRSYKQIAEQVGSPKACRAVGLANNRNPIALVVPCHRVIGADGKMVGFGGGIDLKIALLSLEKR